MRSYLFGAVALLAATAVRAATYPVSARLTLTPRDSQSCLVAPDRAPDCGVIDRARDAFDAAVRRMFTVSAQPDLRLVLTVKRAGIFTVMDGQLEIAVRVQILAPSGDPIDVIDVDGEAYVLEMQEGPIAAAERAAAESAAAAFERAYAGSTKASDYLVAGKIAPASEVRVLERSDKLITPSVGLGLVQGGGDGSFALAAQLRLSMAYRWFFAEASYSRSAPSFNAIQNAVLTDASLSVNDVALEAGVLFRLRPSLDLRAGPGIHGLFGSVEDATPNSVFSRTTLTVYASLSYSFIAAARAPRFVVGIEARGYLGSTVDLPDLGRQVPLANTYFGVSLGVELPFGAKEASAP